MKRIFSLLAVTASLVYFSSCEKDEGRLPNISFKTGTGYVSSSMSIKKDSVFTVGITAAKTEDKDVLTTFTGTVSYNSGADSTLITETLTGSNGDNYTKDIAIRTHNAVGTEKYTFTVVNKDGLKNSISFVLSTN